MPVKCVVVTPETTILEAEGDSVVFPAIDGEVGVLPKRMPMVARLGHGELRVKSGELLTQQMHRLFVSGGFAQVAGDVVTVLTGAALTADEIDVAQVQKHLAAAEAAPASTPESRAEKNRIVGSLKAQIRFAEKK